MDNKLINIDQIFPDENQPRVTFDEAEIDNLAKSIITHGLMQNIVVRPEGEKYIIIAGERRYRACKLVGVKQIPCNIIDSEDTREMALIENIQRVDLDPIEEARALEKLKEIKGYTQEQLAKSLGKTRSYIVNKLRLLTLNEDAQEAINKGLKEGHGRAILSLPKSKQNQLLEEIIEKNLTVPEAEKRAKELKNKENKNKKEENHDKYVQSVLEELEYTFGTKVGIKKKGKQKQLYIEFFDDEDLQAILDQLLKS